MTAYRERQLEVHGCLRVETSSSLWLIEPGRYMRLPRSEAPRPATASCDDALDDAAWHEHRGVFLHRDHVGYYLRLVPRWRHNESRGITTGTLLAVTPPLTELTDELDASAIETSRTAKPSGRTTPPPSG